MTAGQRFPLPAGAAYPLLSMAAAALVWFGASRVGEPSRRAAGRDARRDGRREGVRDGRGRYRPDDRPGDDYWPDDRAAGDHVPEGRYATYGHRDGPAGPRSSAGRLSPAPDPRGTTLGAAATGAGAAGPVSRIRAGRPRGGRAAAGTQAVQAPGPEAVAAGFGPPASAAGSAAAAPARPYGRILIFTLLDDRVADFDRLAEESAEQVRTGEPDTLVYVIHLVPNAPMQRIFYEIYRDRAAFDSHESQPYMQRFVAERRSCVLATNVIELRLKYAKVAPLPNPQPPPRLRPRRCRRRAGRSAGPPRARRRPAPPGPAGPRRDPSGFSRCLRAAHSALTSSATTSSVMTRSATTSSADQERYDQRRPDQRQVPSAGRGYGG